MDRADLNMVEKKGREMYDRGRNGKKNFTKPNETMAYFKWARLFSQRFLVDLVG